MEAQHRASCGHRPTPFSWEQEDQYYLQELQGEPAPTLYAEVQVQRTDGVEVRAEEEGE